MPQQLRNIYHEKRLRSFREDLKTFSNDTEKYLNKEVYGFHRLEHLIQQIY